MPKQLFRDTLLAQRVQLSKDQRRCLSRAAQQALIGSPVFQDAACIALYSPTRGEVETAMLFSAARRAGKKVCYPRVVGERMVFIEVDDLASLGKGAFGLLEPQEGPGVSVADLQLMVVPGVAFDRSGHRLGYGKGFYDRELHSVGFSGVLIGLCYGFQLLDRLPVEAHDVPVACLVSEQGLFFPLRSSDPSGSP
jgi:5-formyltetrahydrofolate cyclo-ligase